MDVHGAAWTRTVPNGHASQRINTHETEPESGLPKKRNPRNPRNPITGTNPLPNQRNPLPKKQNPRNPPP